MSCAGDYARRSHAGKAVDLDKNESRRAICAALGYESEIGKHYARNYARCSCAGKTSLRESRKALCAARGYESENGIHYARSYAQCSRAGKTIMRGILRTKIVNNSLH